MKRSWMWLFVSSGGQSYAQAAKSRAVFSSDDGEQCELIEFYTTFRGWLKAIVFYVKFSARYCLLKGRIAELEWRNSNLPVFRILENLFDDSFCSRYLSKALLTYFQMETFVKQVDQDQPIFYLWENQAWEMSLLHWRRHRSAFPNVAVQHATIRTTDLRLFPVSLGELESRPQPDLIATNGAHAFDQLKGWGLPLSKLRKAEALRYLYLNEHGEDRYSEGLPKKFVILTALAHGENITTLKLADEFLSLQEVGFSHVVIKEHPFAPVRSLLHRFKNLQSAELSETPVAKLVRASDTVLCCNSSTAATEALYKGANVMIAAPANNLNYCPLYRTHNVRFVRNAEECLELVKAPQNVRLGDDFFFLDLSLAGWKSLIAEARKPIKR